MNTKPKPSVEDIIKADLEVEIAFGRRPLGPAEDPPVVHVVYFAGADPRFAEILGRWFEFYFASGCRWPVRVLTDMETNLQPIGHLVQPRAVVQVQTKEWAPVMRANNAFDRKSAIICAALPALAARSVVVDSDAFFMRDPSDTLMSYTRVPFAMAEDAGGRWIGLAEGTIREQSSSVMVFGEEAPGETEESPRNTRNTRKVLAAHYVRAWQELAKTPNQSALEMDIREQRAWSIVKHRTGAPMLPRTCNDSRFWSGPSASTLIYHAHGKEKFTRP
jgi:hypothetical protein